jgi:hypothetical protein
MIALNREFQKSRLSMVKFGKHLGVPTSLVSMYLRGKRFPGLSTAVDIFKRLRLSMDKEFGLSDTAD